jgi:hypothetical protein
MPGYESYGLGMTNRRSLFGEEVYEICPKAIRSGIGDRE